MGNCVTKMEIGGKTYNTGDMTSDMAGQMVRELNPTNMTSVVKNYRRFGLKDI